MTMEKATELILCYYFYVIYFVEAFRTISIHYYGLQHNGIVLVFSVVFFFLFSLVLCTVAFHVSPVNVCVLTLKPFNFSGLTRSFDVVKRMNTKFRSCNCWCAVETDKNKTLKHRIPLESGRKQSKIM